MTTSHRPTDVRVRSTKRNVFRILNAVFAAGFFGTITGLLWWWPLGLAVGVVVGAIAWLLPSGRFERSNWVTDRAGGFSHDEDYDYWKKNFRRGD